MSKKSLNVKAEKIWVQVVLVVVAIFGLYLVVRYQRKLYPLQSAVIIISYVWISSVVLKSSKNPAWSMLVLAFLGVLFLMFLLLS